MMISKLDAVKQAIEAKKLYYETVRAITEMSGVIFPELSSETDRIHIFNGIDSLGIELTTEPLGTWRTETSGYIDGVRVYQLCKTGETKD